MSITGVMLTLQLFFHYLSGSGETVVIQNNKFLSGICRNPESYPSPMGYKNIVSAYGTPYGNALGDFSCLGTVGVDNYDFKYAGDPRYCEAIKTPPRKLSSLEFYVPDVGRCLVGLSKNGKSFKVVIK